MRGEIHVIERQEEESFYTAKTLAQLLAVDETTVKGWIRTGEIASYKLGRARRIAPEDVASFLERNRDDRRAA